MIMAQSIQQRIKTACEDTGGDVTYRKDYSGRGMFNRKCIGIVGSLEQCMALISEVIQQSHSEAFDAAFDCEGDDGVEEKAASEMSSAHCELIQTLLTFERDSMGYDVILYWSNVEDDSDEALTDEWIDQQSERTLLEWVAENSEYHDDGLNVEHITALRATVKTMRDRMEEDVEA